MRLLVLLAAPLSILVLHTAVEGSMAPGRLERWVRSGLQSLQWDQLDRCLRMSSLSEAECRRLAHLPLSAVAVYVSEPRTAAGREGEGHPSLESVLICLIYPEWKVWCVCSWKKQVSGIHWEIVQNKYNLSVLNHLKMCLKINVGGVNNSKKLNFLYDFSHHTGLWVQKSVHQSSLPLYNKYVTYFKNAI